MRQSYLKNAALLTGSDVVLRLAGMGLRIWLANELGGEGMGLYQLVLAETLKYLPLNRYGDPPPSVSDLVNVSLVRVQASTVGVTEVTQKKDTLTLQLESLELPMIRGLLVAFNGRVTAGAGNRPYLSVTLQPDEKPLELLQSILKAMAEILASAEQK